MYCCNFSGRLLHSTAIYSVDHAKYMLNTNEVQSSDDEQTCEQIPKQQTYAW